MLITQHQYLNLYPIDRSATKLILGTIHPHFHEAFELPFFYGNERSIWKILHEAFPQELKDPNALNDILAFLENRKLAISDTIISCRRLNATALDKDLEVIEDNKKQLIDALVNSSITEVLCTSGFGKNNAFRLFYNRILGLPITAAIQKDRQALFTLPGTTKQVLVKAMYSPARTALRGISRSQGYKAVKDEMSVEQYRMGLYRSALSLTTTVISKKAE